MDDTVGNIVSNAGNLSNNKLNYQVFVRDSKENKIVRTSESSGYFLTKADNDLVNLEIMYLQKIIMHLKQVAVQLHIIKMLENLVVF